MTKDYKYSKSQSKLPSWVKSGDRVEIVKIAKESAWYSDKDNLIGKTGSFYFSLWYGGAWFAGGFRPDKNNYIVSESIYISRVCLKKIDKLTR